MIWDDRPVGRLAAVIVVLPLLAVAAGCGSTEHAASKPASYAIYGEYAKGSNKLMKPNLNRRVFNTVEAQSGSDVKLNGDGSIELQPGTYRLEGFSITTMQTTFAPPQPKHDSNYPGYALVYPAADETAGKSLLEHVIAIGSPQTALDGTPSLFDAVYTTKTKTSIAVGHQSGADLHDEVYLSVYSVNGTTSNYHVFARISVTKIR
jgi:hypothetical protein